jgi:hypothetical protein
VFHNHIVYTSSTYAYIATLAARRVRDFEAPTSNYRVETPAVKNIQVRNGDHQWLNGNRLRRQKLHNGG